MSLDLDIYKKQTIPDVFKDPFLKDKIEQICVSVNLDYSGNSSAYGWVKFVNGKTHGEQKFNGKTFDDVVLQIKSFIDQIK